MPKNSKSKSVTMIGGKNIAGVPPQLRKPPKADTPEPEEKKPAPDPEPEKTTE